MPNTALSKRGTVTGAYLRSANSDFGTAGDLFVIKTERIRFRTWSPVIETTGDGDIGPVFENNQRIYGQFSLVGFMVATKIVGLINLKDQETTPPQIGFAFASGEVFPSDGVFNAVCVIEEIQVDSQARGNFVGLSMRGRITDTDLSAAGNDIG